jgi:O-antigen/teichoic acid export membrane protein
MASGMPFLTKIRQRLQTQQGRNALFSGGGALLNPVLQLVIMPLSYRVLGAELFGLWMLLNSIIAASGLATLGMGEAVTRYVAQYSAAKSPRDVLRVSRCVIALFLMVAAFAAFIAVIFSKAIVHSLFAVATEYQDDASLALQVAGVGLLVKFIYAFLEAALRGFERYDIESSIGAMVAVVTTLGAYGVLSLGFGLSAVVGWGIFVMALGVVIMAVKLNRFMPDAIWWRPRFDYTTLKEVARFGVFTWWQTLNGLILYQLDRVIIAISGGVASVGYYSLCMQLIQTIHSVLAKSAGFVFPMAVKLHGERNRRGLWDLFCHGSYTMGWISWLVYAPLIAYAGPILYFWMGPDFASDATLILQVLGLWCVCMSTSIIPFHLMNATGAERMNAYFGSASGGLFVAAGLLAVPHYAALGAAAARLSTVAVSLASRTILFNFMKLERPGVLSGLTIAAQLAGVLSALLVVKSLGHILNPVVFTLVALAAGTVVFGTTLIFTKKTTIQAHFTT